jgi:hypothetical protein
LELKTIIRLAIAAVLIIIVYTCTHGIHSTPLPLNLSDIPTIQAKLDKLPAEESELVLAYLRRSNGDVLPAKFADPDSPFTARTFGEAIKLQREYKVKHAVDIARMEAAKAAREAALEPLRKALSIEIVSREILSADEASGRQPGPGQAIDSRAALVTTYRLRNTTFETMTAASGSVTVRTKSDPKSLLGAAQCWINHTEPLSAGQAAEVRCGNLAKGASDADKAFVALPESSLIITWEPRSITFESGKVLKGEN